MIRLTPVRKLVGQSKVSAGPAHGREAACESKAERSAQNPSAPGWDLLPRGDAVPRGAGVEVPPLGFQQGAVASLVVQHHASVDGSGARA